MQRPKKELSLKEVDMQLLVRIIANLKKNLWDSPALEDDMDLRIM